MSPRKFAAAIAILAIAGALITLFWPVKLNGQDLANNQITCGNSITLRLDQAANADQQNSLGRTLAGGTSMFDDSAFAQQCKSKANLRRAIAIPVGVIGLIVLAGALLINTGALTPKPSTGPSTRIDRT